MNRHYVLLATDGYVNLPVDSRILSKNKRKLYVYGFVGGLYKVYDRNNVIYINEKLNYKDSYNYEYFLSLKGKASIPSPIMWGDAGDNIYITLINLGKKFTDISDLSSINIQGGHLLTQLEEFTELSFGVPIWEENDKCPPTATYCFNPLKPGTYMYDCRADAPNHVQMGMYGAIVIYPSYDSLRRNGIYQDVKGRWIANDCYYSNIPKTATNRNFVYNSINSYYDKEYVQLLSDIDAKWHEEVEKGREYNPVDYRPNYWLINGRAFPDTLESHPDTLKEDENSEELTQINYESYIHINRGELLLLRVINMSWQVVPWHVNGNHFYVLGKDASPSPFLAISQLVNNENTRISVYDLFERGYTLTIASGESYDLLVCGDGKINDHTKFYSLHNHHNYKETNDGVYPGGQLTYMQIDD